jgi:hypothetical protein
MTEGLEPTEEYDGTVTVRVSNDGGGRTTISCSSYEEAIGVVKREVHEATVVEILDREGEVVFDSADMNIENWEVEWKHAKRRLSVDVEERECPYDNVACFADDLCVECKMDEAQETDS